MEPTILLAAKADDPTIPPWVTTAAYLWLAMLCARSWILDRGLRRPRRRFGSPLWLGLAMMFVALAIAKPLGAQAMLTDAFRQRAVRNDWYDVRRAFQFGFIVVVSAAAVLVAGVVAWLATRRKSLRDLAVLTPVVVLLGFLAVRVTSLHQVDAILYRPVLGVMISTAIELSILALVGFVLVRRSEELAAWAGASPRATTPARDEGTGVRRYSVPR